jgi:hypothetical protein
MVQNKDASRFAMKKAFRFLHPTDGTEGFSLS